MFDEVFYFENAELLTNLATNLMEAEAEQIKTQGWAWIEYAFDEDYNAGNKMRTIRPHSVELPETEQKEKNKLDKRYAELRDAASNGDEAACDECEEIEAKLVILEDKAHAYNPHEQAMTGGFLNLAKLHQSKYSVLDV